MRHSKYKDCPAFVATFEIPYKLYCKCGQPSDVDGLVDVECKHCGRKYKMETHVEMDELPEDDA